MNASASINFVSANQLPFSSREKSPGQRKRRIHVVIVGEELPYPPTSGNRIRSLNLMVRLARRHRLTFICHRNANPEEAHRAAEFFAEQDIEVNFVDRVAPSTSGPAFYGRLALNLLSQHPYSVSSHDSLPLRQAIQGYAASHAVDLWACEWTPYAAALRDLGNVRRIVMTQNVESMIWQRYAEVEPNLIKRWYIRLQQHKFQRFERWAVSSAHQIVAVSEEDARVFQESFGARHVSVVDNGVDTRYFQPDTRLRETSSILFLGSLDWRPNRDAVNQLLESIFPGVHKAEPGARLLLVGRHPPAELQRRVQGLPGVELHGDVSDVRPFLNRCGVLAVPLRIGGGSRLKILEALACRLPVVSTAIGAEGLRLEPGTHLTVVSQIEGMAEQLVHAIRNPYAMQVLANAGRQRVLEIYDWDSLADRMEESWYECLNR
ncbi:MAG: glycosyltransferase [Gemmataceae bacterium]